MNFFSLLKYIIGRLFFSILGWKCDIVPKKIGDSYVLIGFPHNTNRDAPYGIGFSFVNRIQTSPMIKKEWMFWPMSMIFKLIKVIPIDRASARNTVGQLVDEFSKRDKFIPVIFPEGTRSKVKGIKTGFWHIAQQANVPIVLLYKNEIRKHFMILGHIYPGLSKLDDLLKIRGIYQNAGYEIPFDASNP